MKRVSPSIGCFIIATSLLNPQSVLNLFLLNPNIILHLIIIIRYFIWIIEICGKLQTRLFILFKRNNKYDSITFVPDFLLRWLWIRQMAADVGEQNQNSFLLPRFTFSFLLPIPTVFYYLYLQFSTTYAYSFLLPMPTVFFYRYVKFRVHCSDI